VSDHVYKKIELAGSSASGIDDAIRNAVSRASETLHNLRWFEVTEIRGEVEDGAIAHWQVALKVGFTLDGDAGD
jgi:flavin-binding protein dodecin